MVVSKDRSSSNRPPRTFAAHPGPPGYAATSAPGTPPGEDSQVMGAITLRFRSVMAPMEKGRPSPSAARVAGPLGMRKTTFGRLSTDDRTPVTRPTVRTGRPTPRFPFVELLLTICENTST